MTYRPSAYCLDCEEEEYMFPTDCCQKHRPGCSVIFRRDTGDNGINATECLPGNGCRKESA